MTDIVIPLIRNTPNNHLELRYALRSFDTHLKGIGKLILVGYCPAWCKPDIYILHPDATKKQYRENNIADKIIAAIPHATESFLYANDDHFILKDYQIKKFPNYYTSIFGGTGGYLKTVENTKALLGDTVNFDTHCPMLIHGQRFIQRMPAEWPDWGYCMKTLYAHDLKGKRCTDSKLRSPDDSIAGRDWFSTADGILKYGLGRRLSNLFPKKSKWEL